MDHRGIAVLGAVLVIVASSAASADEYAAPAPVKTPAHIAKAKAKPKAAAPDAGLAGIKFSDPDAPVIGAKPTQSIVAPSAASAPQQPQGGPSLDLKWHADNQHIDNPYLPPWVPNGQGYNVQAGVKLGF